MNENSIPSAATEDSFVAWELIADCLERLAESWDAHLDRNPPPAVGVGNSDQVRNHVEPDIADFVPDLGPELQHVALVELVKLDLDYRWQSQASDSDEKPDSAPRFNGVPASRLTIED